MTAGHAGGGAAEALGHARCSRRSTTGFYARIEEAVEVAGVPEQPNLQLHASAFEPRDVSIELVDPTRPQRAHDPIRCLASHDQEESLAAYTQRKQRRSQAIAVDYVYEAAIPRSLFATTDVPRSPQRPARPSFEPR